MLLYSSRLVFKDFYPTTRRRIDSSDIASLISSGHVFIYYQQECNIQRWTDGLKWSPSRKLDEFLIYRELNPTASRQLKKNSKRAKTGMISHREPRKTGLYGSLVESYNFKTDGLVKNTITTSLGPSCMRLVSYYRAADVLAGRLHTPSVDVNLWSIRPRAELCEGRDGVVYEDGLIRERAINMLPTMDPALPGLELDTQAVHLEDPPSYPSVEPDALWQYDGDFPVGFSWHDGAEAFKCEAETNALEGEFGNALVAASKGGHEKMVQMLIGAGADVNVEGGEYGNALQAASVNGHEKVVQMLRGNMLSADQESS